MNHEDVDELLSELEQMNAWGERIVDAPLEEL